MSLARWQRSPTEVVFACTMKSASAFRCRASGPSTVAESVASLASARFWPARIFRTWSVLPSAGSARWMTAFRSDPRAARPVPSSFRMIASRCAIGSW